MKRLSLAKDQVRHHRFLLVYLSSGILNQECLDGFVIKLFHRMVSNTNRLIYFQHGREGYWVKDVV